MTGTASRSCRRSRRPGVASRVMEPGGTRRVALLLPMRTILLVAAAIGVLAAFWAIGATFLIVFVGIFLGLVFEYPVRFVMAKTGMSRGLRDGDRPRTAVAVTVLALLLLVPFVGGVRDYLGPPCDGAGSP